MLSSQAGLYNAHPCNFRFNVKNPLRRNRGLASRSLPVKALSSWGQSMVQKGRCSCPLRGGFTRNCLPGDSQNASDPRRFEVERLEVDLGGKQVTLETGEIGRQANGAVMAADGETVIFCTTCCSNNDNKGLDFLPLTIEYQEKFSAAGKTKGGFLKRDRAVDHEILISRLVDRALRPLFPDGWFKETQILEWVMSYDGKHLPEPLAITAASAALAVSDVPFAKPVTGVRVGWTEAKGPIVHPTVAEMEESKLDLVLAGTSDALMMIEGYADFLPEEEMIKALKAGMEAVSSASQQIADWAAKVGKKKQLESLVTHPEGAVEFLEARYGPEIESIFQTESKSERNSQSDALWEKIVEEQATRGENDFEEVHLQKAFKTLKSKVVRERIKKESMRIDGRTVTEIRPIYSRANVLPRTHGSALFTRGGTQALCVTTLGGQKSAQRINTIKEEDDLKFYLQYFFPPSSVGEVRRYGGMAGRREIGHGQLASRCLESIVPKTEVFPYTIRVESTITESDGSSSMASVCGGCLAMMDADDLLRIEGSLPLSVLMAQGVPIKRPIAGIAMGLVLSGDTGEFTVLSDILGTEDALGDMDFKVAGDAEGITGFQLDMKVEGITIDVISQALLQARDGRVHILEQMANCSPKPRGCLSEYAPALVHLQIEPEKAGDVIGAKGRVVKEIIDMSGADSIDVNSDGLVMIECDDVEQGQKAADLIQLLAKQREIGEIFRDSKVVKTLPYGAFINILPGTDGMLHIGEIPGFADNMEDVLKVGDTVDVQVLGFNKGKIRLTTEILESKEAIAMREKDAKAKSASQPSSNSTNGKKSAQKTKPKQMAPVKKEKELPPVVLGQKPMKKSSG